MARFRCASCGQGWEKHPATVVPCPSCQAPAGSPCRRPSGHYASTPHVDRERHALKEGLLELCPEGPTARAKRGHAA